MNGILSNPFAGSVVGIVLAYLSIRYLRKQHASAVHTVFYAFSLALVATSMVGAWGVSEGVIGANGSFNGDAGRRLNALLSVAVDVKLDCLVALAAAAILIVPQLCSYVFSGLFGCAARPQFVDQSISIALWLFAKSFATAGGVFAAVLLFAIRFDWTGLGGAMALQISSVVSLCMGFSFVFVASYYFAREELKTEFKPVLAKSRYLLRVDQFFTRHRAPRPSEPGV